MLRFLIMCMMFASAFATRTLHDKSHEEYGNYGYGYGNYGYYGYGNCHDVRHPQMIKRLFG